MFFIKCSTCGATYDKFQIHPQDRWPLYYCGAPPSFLCDPQQPDQAKHYFCSPECAAKFLSKKIYKPVDNLG